MPRIALRTFSEASNPTAYNAIAAAMAVYPLPTFGFNPTAGTGEANVYGNTIAHENFILGRFDYTLSDKDAIFLRYFYDKQHVIDPVQRRQRHRLGRVSALLAGARRGHESLRHAGMEADHFAHADQHRRASASLGPIREITK